MIRPIWLSAAVTLWLYATKLQVQIQPEAHLAPQQISLSFRVSPDGSSEVTRQTESIAAWVRALPVSGSGCTFDAAQPADLISNWTRFASLACAVTFFLISPRTLPPGSYTGTVDLVLRAE